MLKNKNFIYKIGLLILCLVFSRPGIAQEDKKLSKLSVTLGAQNINSPYGGFLDLTEGKVYTLDEAAENQKKIDLVYTYGKTTMINLLAPSSAGLNYFGKRYKDNTSEWDTKNKGSFIVMEDNKENRKLYKATTTNEELKDLYVRAFKEVTDRKDYDRKKHGPRVRVGSINIGDYIVFRSRSKDIYAVGRIVDFVKGYQGNIRLDLKVTNLE
ncbi:MAG TPA: hypothetical protein VK102_10270 [Sphingobacterium sp.]|nr:hypothetical protein [Sphingobacterium sp.]